MTRLPTELYSAAQTRELDQLAASKFGLSVETLMARAGQAAFTQLRQHWPEANTIAIFCGNGHNGGDGLVLARLLIDADYSVQIYQPTAAPLAPATEQARKILTDAGLVIADLPMQLPVADVIVDALLGTGINREVSGHYAEIIDLINAGDFPIFSLDIPSGLNADTGCIQGRAIQATITLSFLGLNTGLFTADGPDCSGQILFDDLSVPATLYDGLSPVSQRIHFSHYQTLLAPRKRNAHKGLFGHSWIVGSDQGMSGAARMTAEAALRVGAGLCSVLTHPGHASTFNLGRPEIMCHAGDPGQPCPERFAQASVIAVGPGLGHSQWSQFFYHHVLSQSAPLVIDADALHLLAQHPQRRDNWILTPHPGEAATLLDCTTTEVQQDRFKAVETLQARYGGVVILKGAGTLVHDGKNCIKLSEYGNPGMSSGGMGDVLTGVIAGLLAQSLTLSDAACLGVILHGLAGDLAAQDLGERGLLATDLLPYLHMLVNEHEGEAGVS